MDMPVDIAAALPQHFDIQAISGKIAGYWPVIEKVRTLWDYNDVQSLLDGRLAVPDEIINEALADYAAERDDVTSVSIESRDDGRFLLAAELAKLGRVNLLCRIDEFVYNEEQKHIKIKVLEKELPDNGTMSWLFSRLSLSMTQKLLGKVELADEAVVKFHGNTMTIDYAAAADASPAAQTELFGTALADMVRVDGAAAKEGCIELQASLTVPDNIRAMLLRIVKKEDATQ